jgi:spermidine synthase
LKKQTKYDVVLLNIPPPLTAETNRYYTFEFFKLLKQHLNHEGIIKTQLPSSANYLSKEAEKNFSVLYATLSAVFKNVKIIPGEKDYFLASDKNIDLNVVAKITEKQIENQYIAYYLDDFSIEQRSQIITERIKNAKILNYDFKPVSYPAQIKSQMAKFKTNYWILGIFVFLFLIFILKNIDASGAGMFAVGFASITAELLIIFAFQILYGNIFSLLSVIIMIFMGGLALGALYLPKYLPEKPEKLYKKSLWALSVLLVALPFLFVYVLPLIQLFWLNYILIFILTFIIAALSGSVFYFSEQLSYAQHNESGGKLYSIDLFGSAIGALATSMILIPLAGVIWTGIIAGMFCLFAGFVKK